MDFVQVIERRASIRRFDSTPVPPDHLREIVRIAGLAPSVNNSQPWRFIGITDSSLLQQMAEAVREQLDRETRPGNRQQSLQLDYATFFARAPAVITVCREQDPDAAGGSLPGVDAPGDDPAQWEAPVWLSLGACIENLLLAAVNLRYGACWLSAPLVARNELEHLLQIKQPWSLAALVAIGIPLGPPTPRGKNSIEDIYELRAAPVPQTAPPAT